MLNDFWRQPRHHSSVAAPCFTRRSTGEVKKSNILSAAQASMALFDICTNRVGTGGLLRNQPIASGVFHHLAHILYNQTE